MESLPLQTMLHYQGKLGNPRTAANHSIPGKAEKAAKARERDLPRDLTE